MIKIKAFLALWQHFVWKEDRLNSRVFLFVVCCLFWKQIVVIESHIIILIISHSHYQQQLIIKIKTHFFYSVFFFKQKYSLYIYKYFLYTYIFYKYINNIYLFIFCCYQKYFSTLNFITNMLLLFTLSNIHFFRSIFKADIFVFFFFILEKI